MNKHNEQMAAEEQHFASIEPYQSDHARLQAENARLTAENEQLRTEASRRLDVIQHQQNVVLQMLNDENLRLREALAFYGKYENYERYNPEPRSVIDDDCGQIALKALGGE